jgi:hypothetical protein
MNKKEYKITRESEWFKVEVFDEHGFNTTVYEKSVMEASLFIINWWKNTEERLKTHKLLEDAIYGCTKLDEELGLLKGNRDNLD